MRTRNVTLIHHAILGFIAQFHDTNGYMPTYREIARGCGWRSHSTVKYHLERLQAMGLITHEPWRARSIRLTEKGLDHARA